MSPQQWMRDGRLSEGNRQDDKRSCHPVLIEEFKGLKWTPLAGATGASFAVVGQGEDRAVFRIPAGAGGIQWAARPNSIEGIWVDPRPGFALARVLPGRTATVDYGKRDVVEGLLFSGALDLLLGQETPRRLAADACFEVTDLAAGYLSLACRSSEPCLLLLPPNYETDPSLVGPWADLK